MYNFLCWGFQWLFQQRLDFLLLWSCEAFQFFDLWPRICFNKIKYIYRVDHRFGTALFCWLRASWWKEQNSFRIKWKIHSKASKWHQHCFGTIGIAALRKSANNNKLILKLCWQLTQCFNKRSYVLIISFWYLQKRQLLGTFLKKHQAVNEDDVTKRIESTLRKQSLWVI